LAATVQEKLRSWAFLAVPAIALLELGAHVVQARSARTDDDWRAARDATKAMLQPDDLVVFAPKWVDPVGRAMFGDEIATLEREAYGDVSRFPRAIEVSIRGQRSRDLATWNKTDEKKVRGVTLTTYANPDYQKTLDDLVTHLDPARASVSSTRASVLREGEGGSEVDETPCPWSSGAGAQTGNLGFGPAIPGNRFQCSSTFAGVSVVTDLDYAPHRVIYVPPTGHGTATRITFRGVSFGKTLHGHHGLYVEAERGKDGPQVVLRFFVGKELVGRVTHADGQGWKGFDLDTSAFSGTTSDLVADVSSDNGNRRMYGFEAITR
jgi:hypothetical protein